MAWGKWGLRRSCKESQGGLQSIFTHKQSYWMLACSVNGHMMLSHSSASIYRLPRRPDNPAHQYNLSWHHPSSFPALLSSNPFQKNNNKMFLLALAWYVSSFRGWCQVAENSGFTNAYITNGEFFQRILLAISIHRILYANIRYSSYTPTYI